MPLIEIDLLEGRVQTELDAISEAVHEAMVTVLEVPQSDRFQIITERPARYLRFDPNHLGHRP
jgi:4-oxalocrotonate tautomerase